ncbi:putative T7SS-secreted protein [Streptomyces bungoensis]
MTIRGAGAGRGAVEQAKEAYNKRVVAYDAALMSPDEDPGPRPGDFHDPATADFEHAREVLEAARRQRDTAAGIASDAVQTALAHAPAEPPPLTQLKVDAVDGYDAFNTEAIHFGAGVIKGTAGLYAMVRGANPLDPYNLTHPAEALQHQVMTLAGLVSSATHPERTLKTTLQEFIEDPAEFGGRLTPQVLPTDGVGLEAGGIRAAAREGMESGATSVATRGAQYGDDLAGGAVHADSLAPDAARSFLDDEYPELKDLNVPHSGSAESGFNYPPHVSDDVWRKLDVDQKHQVGAAELSDGAISFPDAEAATAYGRQQWDNYAENLPHSQQQAIRDYTDEPLIPGKAGSATYKEMNGYLRGNAEFGTPEVLQSIQEVDRALAGNPLPQDVVVVRGTNMTRSFMDDKGQIQIYGEVLPVR